MSGDVAVGDPARTVSLRRQLGRPWGRTVTVQLLVADPTLALPSRRACWLHIPRSTDADVANHRTEPDHAANSSVPSSPLSWEWRASPRIPTPRPRVPLRWPANIRRGRRLATSSGVMKIPGKCADHLCRAPLQRTRRGGRRRSQVVKENRRGRGAQVIRPGYAARGARAAGRGAPFARPGAGGRRADRGQDRAGDEHTIV